ncbi:phosphatase PAP2 family protein [Gemella sanguinis]|jgi:PAP2 family protein|uniref:phosphatase PAP2 family protein n=1 Tax=Gemella sanguinis TaxID=84135 RepID=UPI0004E26C25|nr:phosphatase PAP2 family protein [Gemella sanguinis]NKZ25924.1 phosphatase PAP2 family protein [Gemella sanguinis]
MNKNNFKILITVVILTFLFLSQGYNNILKPFDLKIISYIQSLENEYLTVFYKMITIIADTYQSAIITILLVTFLYFKKHYREALFLAITMTTCGLAMPLLKNIFRRERPNFYRLIEISGYSFPSGHTTSATTMYLTLAIILLSIMKKLNKYFVFSIAVLGIVIIGSSRIYLGVHYPTDVMAGICLGISIVSTVYCLYYSNPSEED